MYNTVLGALPLHKNGDAFYYSNYHAHGHKTYLTFYGGGIEWPCCSGTLPQVAADYRISAYFRDKDGVSSISTFRRRYAGDSTTRTSHWCSLDNSPWRMKWCLRSPHRSPRSLAFVCGFPLGPGRQRFELTANQFQNPCAAVPSRASIGIGIPAIESNCHCHANLN
jgi:hypothetical protein